MKIIDLNEFRLNSNILLVLSGILLYVGLNLLGSFLSKSIIILTQCFGFSYQAYFYFPIAFQGLIIIGLIILLIIVLLFNNKDVIIIKLRQKHFMAIGIIFTSLALICLVMTYLTEVKYIHWQKEYFAYRHNLTDYDIIYENFIKTILEIINGTLLLVLFFVIIKLDQKTYISQKQVPLAERNI